MRKITMLSKVETIMACALLLLNGCAFLQQQEAQETEQVLSAAGFQMKLADTSDKLADLQGLPPLKLVPHQKDGALYYVYADPQNCKCVYVGDEQAYQRYQRLALKERIAEEQQSAAMMNEDAALNWGLWGPFGPWF